MTKHKVLIALTVSAALMSGCAKNIWTNPNVSDRQEQKDLTQCQRNAEIKNELMQSCMTAKGYHLVSAKQ